MVDSRHRPGHEFVSSSRIPQYDNQRSVHRLTWKIRSTELITRSLEKCNVDVYFHSIVEASGAVALTFTMVLKQVLMAQNMN